MKIGYFVQGDADEAFVKGIVKRYCENAILEEGKFRGSSKQRLIVELPKALEVLHIKNCDYLIVLTDSDNAEWREVYKRELKRIPIEYQHFTVFGVAERNIECWLGIDKQAIASELGCNVNEIPNDDPSGFVKRKFGINHRDEMKEDGKNRIKDFVASAVLYNWIKNSDSFNHFWDQMYQLSKNHQDCKIPNEAERPK